MANIMRFVEKAKSIAEDLENNEHKIVAIITNKRGHILSAGWNSYKQTHPTQAYYAKKCGNRHKIYLHAEIDALVKCDKKPYAIYVVRVNNQGKLRLARPCNICMEAILDSDIEKVYYSDDSGHVIESILKY